MSVPQHWEELPQLAPWLLQLVPLEQTPLTQDKVPQHWPELVQEAPEPLQPEAPEQTPPEQVKVPQHWDELEHEVPALWQLPPVQTLLELQVRTPQQSPLDWQRWFWLWQGPVRLGSTGGSEPPPPQARLKTRGAASRAIFRSVQSGRTMSMSLSPIRRSRKPGLRLGRPARRGAGLPA